MAQRFGHHFDGIVAMSPAIHWDRWAFSGGWGNYVAHAGARAERARHGQVPGREPARARGLRSDRRHHRRHDPGDATAARTTRTGRSAASRAPPPDPALCLTPAEAARGEQDLGRPAQRRRHARCGSAGNAGAGNVFGITPGGDRRADAVRRADQSLLGPQGSDVQLAVDQRRAEFLDEQRQPRREQFSPFIGSDSPDLHDVQGKRRQDDRQLRQPRPDHPAQRPLQLHAAPVPRDGRREPRRRTSIATTSSRTPRTAAARA